MMAEEFNIQLELKERIDYTDILETSIKNKKDVIKSDTFKFSKLQTMIIDDFTDIPNTWIDKEFAEDIKKVVKIKRIPNIVKFGGVPLSKEYMKRKKIPLTKKVKQVSYFILKMAIINLLDRRNMLIRKDKIEQSTGVNLQFETIDDLIDSLNPDDEE
jgi:hypothetical protein